MVAEQEVRSCYEEEHGTPAPWPLSNEVYSAQLDTYEAQRPDPHEQQLNRQPTKKQYHHVAAWVEKHHCDSAYVVVEEVREPQEPERATAKVTVMETPQPATETPQSA